MLIQAGAEVDLVCDDMTPCMWAASAGFEDVLSILVHQGKADLNKIADDLNLYGSPMHMACLCNHT